LWSIVILKGLGSYSSQLFTGQFAPRLAYKKAWETRLLYVQLLLLLLGRRCRVGRCYHSSSEKRSDTGSGYAGEHHSKHEHSERAAQDADTSRLLGTRIKADRSHRRTTAHSTKSRRARAPLLLLLHPLPLDVLHSIEVHLHPLVDRFPVLQLSACRVQESVQHRFGVLALAREN